MRKKIVSVPELAMIAGTRGALGFGLGLLLADRFNHTQRRAVGWTMFLFGALSTIPLAFEVLGSHSPPRLAPDQLDPGEGVKSSGSRERFPWQVSNRSRFVAEDSQ